MTVAGRLCILPSVAARVRDVQALCRLGWGLLTVGVTHAAGCPSAMLRAVVRVAAARFRWTWAAVSGFRRCAPWSAKRRRVVPGRRRRGRVAGGGEGARDPKPAEATCRAHPTRRQAIREGSGGARAAASQRARGEAATGAGRTGATKVVAKERVRPAAGAPGRIHERHATLLDSNARPAVAGATRLGGGFC